MSKPIFDDTMVAAMSLVVAPLMMSVGDLLHPQESMNAAAQAAVIIEQPSRWYVAHMLLFFGILLFIPGIVGIASLTAEQAPRTGYVAGVLSLAGVASFAGVFVGEMLIGRYVSDGADASAETTLLSTFESGPVLGVVMLGGLALFAGVVSLAVPLIRAGGPLRWAAVVFVVALLMIGGEIATAQVLLSQIGNLAFLVGGVVFAREIVRKRDAARAS